MDQELDDRLEEGSIMWTDEVLSIALLNDLF